MTRSAKTLAVQALVVVALVGGTTAFVSLDKKITLTVDGHRRTMHTFAKTVGEVLAREHVHVRQHDTVAPAASTVLADGTHVAVRYGRLLHVSVDGQRRQVWVTATSVAEALQQLDMRVDGAYVSASRSAPIGREGLQLAIRTPRSVTVAVDGQRRTVTTTDPTVALLLTRLGISLGKYDQVSVPLNAWPEAGTMVSVLHLKGKLVKRQVEIPFKVKKIKDGTHFTGWEDVLTPGVAGRKIVMYEQRTDGGETRLGRKISEQVLKRPRTEVVKVGTKPLPRSVAGADDLNWDALAQCESHGNPKAVNSAGPYYGLYQFSAGTWHAVGGSGIPTDASAAEQTYRAKLLYVRSGAGQWPVCGKNLFT